MDEKEITTLRKEVNKLEKDKEEKKGLQETMYTEIEKEKHLIEDLQERNNQVKKVIYEAKKDKEKLIVIVKNAYKIIESLAKRKETLDGDSSKLLMEFQDTMQQDLY